MEHAIDQNKPLGSRLISEVFVVICSALMPLYDDHNPFPFMHRKKSQNPTQERTYSFPLPSRNPQFSGLDWLNIGESSTSRAQKFDMNLSNPYRFNDYGSHETRLNEAQNPTVKGTFLPLSSRNKQHSGGWLNHIGETSSSSQVQEFDMNLSNSYDFYDYGTNYKHEAALHNMDIIGATVQDLQNPTFVGTSVPSYSKNLQGSGFVLLNYGQKSAHGVQSLLPLMEELNLSKPCDFYDYDTDLMYESALHHLRVNGAADYATLPRHNLEPHSGHTVSVAKDPRGSRLLQKKIDEGTPQEICKVLKELKYHLHELIKHPFGHFVIQKLFQSSNISVDQKNDLVYLIIVDLQKLKNVCMDDQGNRVIQQILAKVKEPSMLHKIAVTMPCITVALMKNFNGGFVIHQCLKLFPPVYQNVILDVVANDCVDIAKDKCGCFSIQKCIEYDELPAFMQLVDKLILNAVDLAEDSYGNYVMQFLVKRMKMEVNAILISRLRDRYVRLSMDKYASNVVEYLLRFSGADHAAVIARELMECPEFLGVVQHPYGNYVVQRALQYTEGPLYERLRSMILSNEKKLNNCLYGKRVLQYARYGR